MAKKAPVDLFAPPTKEELEGDLFAPPTEEELAEPSLLDKAKQSGKGLLKGTLEALPMAGGLVGGALGTVAGPFGTIGGAALGGGAGKALENIGEKYLLDEEKSKGDIYIDPALATLEGVTGEMGGQLLSKGISKIPGLIQKVTPQIKGLLGSADESASPMMSQMMQATDTPAPTTFKGIEKQLKQTGKLDVELPSAERLKEIETILPDMQYKPTGIHKEMLSSKSNLDEMRVKFKELPSKERNLLDKYDQAMKSEIQEKIKGVARNFNPAPRDLVKSGDEFMTAIDDTYKTNKQEIGPLFQKIDKVQIPKTTHIDTLVNRLADEIPEVGKNLEILEDGSLKLKSFSPKMGLSKKEYGEISQVFDAINEGSLDFKDMQNMREYLRKSIDPMNPRETAALSAMRKALLGHMEDVIQHKKPGLDVRGTFQKWAINEKNLDDITDIIGGKVGGFDESLKADPGKIVNRIFSNPKNVRMIKGKIPDEQFNALLGDYINDIYSKSFDTAKNQFSSAKFAQNLKTAAPVLNEIAPAELKRLSALADLSKIIPDMAPVNPSGTAKTSVLMEAGKKALNLQFGEAGGELAKGAKGLISERSAKKAAEESLSGVSKSKKKAKMVSDIISGKFGE